MVSVPVVVRETLHMVHPPHLCVLVAQDWPSLVITLQALRLSITMAAFLAKYHSCCKPLSKNQSTAIVGKYVVLVSGTSTFVEEALRRLDKTQYVLMGLEMDLLR